MRPDRRSARRRTTLPRLRPLEASFYSRPAAEVAPDLLGCLLISEAGGERTSGRIVETEAYTGPDDPASHAAAAIGRTARNDPLYGPPGTAYIHLNYGIHWCMNTVTDREGYPAAVLIRAIEPVDGEEVMLRRRRRAELTNGPARLTSALGIGPELQRHSLVGTPLWIESATPVPEADLVTTVRVGISKGAAMPLRFYDRRSRWVSRR